jgi:hypothetical protein
MQRFGAPLKYDALDTKLVRQRGAPLTTISWVRKWHGGVFVEVSQAGEDFHDLVLLVPVLAGKPEQFTTPNDNLTQSGRVSNHRHASAALEFQKALISEMAKGAEHRVVVDPAYSRHVSSRRQPPTGLDLTFGDLATEFGCHLKVHGQPAVA